MSQRLKREQMTEGGKGPTEEARNGGNRCGLRNDENGVKDKKQCGKEGAVMRKRQK